jgi:hypothetical protein
LTYNILVIYNYLDQIDILFSADADIALVACPGKKKRSVFLDDEDVNISISKSDR